MTTTLSVRLDIQTKIQMGLHELDGDVTVDHKQVSTWLRSWGGKRERKAPRV